MENIDMKNTAVVIRIKERYFRGFGKIGQIKTAWSLAGAKLFGPWCQEAIVSVEDKLKSKGKKYQLMLVVVST